MRAVRKRFGATLALDGVDLDARAGEVLALVGENGAGKSTLMKVLAGALAPDSGEMTLDGEPYAPAAPLDARRRGVAMIHQELALAPHLSVAENVMLGGEPRRGLRVDWSALRSRAHDALAQLGRADLDVRRRVDELSAADRQLVEIARAVAFEARVVVLDEPTSSLGREDVARLFQLVRRLRSRGAAVVYISHVLEEIFALAQHFVVLRDGRSVARGACADSSPPQLVAAMVGRELEVRAKRAPTRAGEVVVSLQRVAGARLPLEATLEVRRGEVVGLAGLVGAGRTELLRAVMGLEPVRSGSLKLLALSGPRTPHERWRQGVGMLSEDRKREGLALGLSVADNLCLPRLPALARRGWLEGRDLGRSSQRWIDALRIKCAGPQQRVGALSGGNQQKVALARLLEADVDVLLLDEPTRGVDVGAKAEIYALIDAFARGEQRQRAVIVVSSYLPELFGMCDSIAVMERGRLHAARPVHELDEHAVIAQATGGAA
jgi:ribose transport system ATP-binding protein